MGIKHHMTLVAEGDRALRATRKFNAPRKLVFEALTRPDMLGQWFGGPPGWSLVVCEFEARVGGSYRYVWRNSDGKDMGMGGTVLEFVPVERVVTTEKFDDPWYPGEAVGSIDLTEEAGVTTLTLLITYDSPASREAVLRSPMEQGMALGYDNLERFLGTLTTHA